MPAPLSAQVFLDVVRRSRLVDPAALDRLLADTPGADALPAPELAGRLMRDGLITPFQATHLLQGKYKNFFIGKFKVLQPLGSGGMSQVYLCEHAVMRHRVALKLLPAKESKDPASVTRFLREARAAAAVNHPNLVRAHDVDQAEDGKYYYLIMDYVDGVNLHDLVRKVGPLPPAEAAHYVAQAAVGLEHVFECGLVHRDIKPSNLMLDRAGVVRVTDLGLARFTDDTADHLTKQLNSNAILGTADYLAPEQAMNAPDLDVRADIYSLGATLYYLLSGKAPFEASSVPQKLLAHQLKDPPPLPGVPDELQAVLRKMMAKKPEDRYQTPAEVVDALAPWTAEPLPPPPEGYFPDRGPAGTGAGSGGPRTAPPSSTAVTRTVATARGLSSSSTGRYPRPPSSRAIRLPGDTSVGGGSGIRLVGGPPTPSPTAARRKWLGPAAGMAAAVLVAVAAAVVLKQSGKSGGSSAAVVPQPGPGPAAVAGEPPPAGSLVVGPDAAFPTVAAAVAAAGPGGRVVVLGPEHVEPPLVLSKVPAGLTVQGWPDGKPVTWRPTAGSDPARPLVTVADCDGLTLTNLHLDGRGDVAVLVEATGHCAGLRLDRVAASGFRTAGVRLAGTADPDRPAVLDRVRLSAAGEAGVEVAAARHVRLDRCRFDGGLRAGVRVSAPADGLVVRRGRFDAAEVGVALGGDAAAHALLLDGGTFAECGVGLEVAAVSAPAPRVQVRNCLFFKTKLTARCPAAEGKPLAADAPWVWFDDKLEKNPTAVPPGPRYFRGTFALPAGADAAGAVLDVGAADGFRVWVNGTEVGHSDPPHFTKRVYAFPVGKLLTPGRNVIAVEGQHTRDPINPGYATAAGLTARVGVPGRTPWGTADGTWKATDSPPADGWTAAGFDDAGWPRVKVWEGGGYVLPWQGSVWDTAVAAQLGLPTPAPFAAAGNVRDYHSQDGFPLLNCVRGYVPALAGADPADDATYLRTPRAVPKLLTAGVGGGPVGVPAE